MVRRFFLPNVFQSSRFQGGRLALLCLAGLLTMSFPAAATPMTIKELDFLVRMHTPENEIFDQVRSRKLVSPLDEVAAKKMVSEGASRALIDKIKGGDFVLPAPTAAAVPDQPVPAPAPASGSVPSPVTPQTAGQASAAVPGGNFPTLEELLPTQDFKVDLMGAKVSPRAEELAQRFSSAVEANRDWFSAYAKQHEGEKSLPYDEKMGLTKAEYQEYVAIDSQQKLVKTGEATVLAKKLNGTTVELRLDNSVNVAQPIVIDYAKKTFKTPLITIPLTQAQDSGPNGGPLGPYKCYVWQGRTGDPKTGNFAMVSFVIGQLNSGEHRYIQYQVMEVTDGKADANVQTLWYF